MANGWGGRRIGAGRPRKPPVLLNIGPHDDPKAFLLAVMSHSDADMRLRMDCARTLLHYMHPLRGNAADVKR